MDYPTFKKMAGILAGVDLNGYKSQQMDRRIHSLMQSWKADSYDDFLEILKTDAERFKEFVNKLTINVSEFFRNPERFEELWHRVLPLLLEKNQNLQIWSAGCSDGSEPYSIAIIIKELAVEHRVKILATDIDRQILEKAKEAVYLPNQVRNLPPNLLGKYFDSAKDGVRLQDNLKSLVEFKYHNLLVDPYPTEVDLIVCRNVVIYFTEDSKRYLYQKFFESLKPGGFLLVGGTEPLLNYRQLGYGFYMSSFYRRPEQT